jgi:hypothetical protein
MTFQPSICIPKVHKNVTKNFIYDVFNNLQFGNIKKIDIIYYNNNRNFNYSRVFIHFDKWFTHIPIIKTYYDKLINGENLSIVYSEPWYWRIFLYKTPNPS